MDEFSDLEIIRDHLINKDGLILNKIKDGVKYRIAINVNVVAFQETLYFEKSVIGLHSLLYDHCVPSENPFPLLETVNVLVLYDNVFYLRGVSINIMKVETEEDKEFVEWVLMEEPKLNHVQSFTEFI